MSPAAFELELAALIERFGQKLNDNQIITGLERALDEALVLAGDVEASKIRRELRAALSDLVLLYEGVCGNLPFGMMGRAEIAADLAPARAAIAKATAQ